MQIDGDAIGLMTDEELTKYVPLHGDRVKLRHYLKIDMKETRSFTKKQKLLAILREKVEEQRSKRPKQDFSDEEDMRRVNGQPGNKHAAKRDRMIELGWIHKTNTGSVQVRAKKGGGTRKIRMSKKAMKNDILLEGKRLFFPNGESTKGMVNEFDLDVWDFKDRPLREDICLEEMYKETQMPVLRFYLATVQQTQNHLESDDSLPEIRPRSDTKEPPNVDILEEAMNMAGIEQVEHEVNDVNTQAVEVIEHVANATMVKEMPQANETLQEVINNDEMEHFNNALEPLDAAGIQKDDIYGARLRFTISSPFVGIYSSLLDIQRVYLYHILRIQNCNRTLKSILDS